MANTSGFSGLGRPETTDWEEHSAQADLSTGRRFKAVQSVPMKVIIDEVDATTTYVGKSKPGIATSDPYWRLIKISKSGNVTTIAFANGKDTFENLWTDRLSLTYS